MKKILSNLVSIFLVLMLIISNTNVFAADADFDSSFDIGWWFNGVVRGIAIDNTDRIFAVWFFTSFSGTTYNRIIKIQPDGAVDPWFGVWAWFDLETLTIAVQPDWKILVGWRFSNYNWSTYNKIIRLQSDWHVDNTFNIWAWFDLSVKAIAINDNWDIFVWWDFTTYSWMNYNRIVKLRSNWLVDWNFSIWTWFDNSVNSIVIDGDWQIIVWWEFSYYGPNSANKIIRLTDDWHIDNTL